MPPIGRMGDCLTNFSIGCSIVYDAQVRGGVLRTTYGHRQAGSLTGQAISAHDRLSVLNRSTSSTGIVYPAPTQPRSASIFGKEQSRLLRDP